ncbi:hypothetical protein FQA39_LY17839 [Lamprigera yunnana]|nr:hypothetical protein FQA39_LY17839 [Lamprigera yunnana]
MKILLIVVTILFQTSLQVKEDILKISIYYESLCPDSIRFITKQLYPSYAKIDSSVELDFVPYGKATQHIVNGQWVFKCQHHKRECQGNKYQVCGLSQNVSQQQKIDFVNCVMESFNPVNESTIVNCACKFELSSDDILECGRSQQGDELLAKNGDQTHAVKPKITFIPTIVFNNIYDDYIHKSAFNSFLSTVYRILRHQRTANN